MADPTDETRKMISGILAALEAEDMQGLSLEDLKDAMSHPRAAETVAALIGRDGRVAYKGGMGPMFFRPLEWEQAIRDHLAA